MPAIDCAIVNLVLPGSAKAPLARRNDAEAKRHVIEIFGTLYFTLFDSKNRFDNPYISIIPRVLKVIFSALI